MTCTEALHASIPPAWLKLKLTYHSLPPGHRYPSWIQTTIQFSTGFTTQIRLRHRLSRKIAVINKRLDEIIKNKNVYKVEGASNRTSIRWTSASTTMFLATTKL